MRGLALPLFTLVGCRLLLLWSGVVEDSDDSPQVHVLALSVLTLDWHLDQVSHLPDRDTLCSEALLVLLAE